MRAHFFSTNEMKRRKAIVTVSARSQLDLCGDRIPSTARSVVSAEGSISLMDNSYNPATLDVQAPDQWSQLSDTDTSSVTVSESWDNLFPS